MEENREQTNDEQRMITGEWRDQFGRYMAPSEYTEADTMTFDCLPTIPPQIAQLLAGTPDTTL